jgi:hypothetical protein
MSVLNHAADKLRNERKENDNNTAVLSTAESHQDTTVTKTSIHRRIQNSVVNHLDHAVEKLVTHIDETKTHGTISIGEHAAKISGVLSEELIAAVQPTGGADIVGSYGRQTSPVLNDHPVIISTLAAQDDNTTLHKVDSATTTTATKPQSLFSSISPMVYVTGYATLVIVSNGPQSWLIRGMLCGILYYGVFVYSRRKNSRRRERTF